MTSEHNSTGSDTPGDGTDESLNALLEAAQAQLRDVVEQATSSARKDVEAAAAVLEEREIEIAAMQATLSAERLRLAADRAVVAKEIAEVTEGKKALDAQAFEVKDLNERATKGLADALERSAQVIEEADARIEENEARSRAEIVEELIAARTHASDLSAQANRRLEAVGTESEAMLQRAVDRGLKIVATAEVSTERSKAELRQLVTQIEEYLEREKTQIDLESELQIDLRQGAGEEIAEETAEETADDADSTDVAAELPDEPEPAEVQPVLVGTEVPSEEPGPLRSADAVACDDAMEEYFEPSKPEDAAEAESAERMADAVRRAVRGWSASRQEAE